MPGLPDGIFLYIFQIKSQLWYILEGLGMENVGIFYGHFVSLKLFVKLYCRLVYFEVIWYIFAILVCCT
jgi:hypothetical protein